MPSECLKFGFEIDNEHEKARQNAKINPKLTVDSECETPAVDTTAQTPKDVNQTKNEIKMVQTKLCFKN